MASGISFLKSGVQLCSYSLLSLAGSLAPAFLLDHVSVASVLLASATGAAAMAGALRVNIATQKKFDREREKLPDTEALLRNHDLNLLIAAALEKGIGSLPDGGERAAALSKASPGFLKAVEKTSPEELSQASLPNLAVQFAAAQGGKATAGLNESDWGEIVLDLVMYAGMERDRSFEAALSKHLAACFQQLLIGIFKEDATGRGPAQGRGWAALTLMFWGKLFSDVQELRQQNVELLEELAEFEKRLGAKVDELARWNGSVVFAGINEGLGKWLGSLRDELGSQIDGLKQLVAHGLISPEEFRRGYWKRRRQDPELKELWSDPGRAGILMERVVGRDREGAVFEAFLKQDAPWLQFWRGMPGTGKSRLMLEFARRATEAGWRVFFISEHVHDLAAALRTINSAEPVLLIWDDYQGGKTEALRTFLDPPEVQAPSVKLLITAWPTVNVLGEKASNKLYETRDLAAIVPEEALADYARSLWPRLTWDDARWLVRRAEGQPEAVLQAVVLMLGGTAVRDLPPNLMARAYDNLLDERLNGFWNDVGALSLIGRFDLSDAGQRAAVEEVGASVDRLRDLVKRGMVFQEGSVLSLPSDGFRAHVVRRCLTYQPIFICGDPKRLAGFAKPLLMEFFDRIWAVCVLAVGNLLQGNEVRSALLEKLRVEEIGGIEDAVRLGTRIFAATVVEVAPQWCEALTDGIALIREKHDTSEIALQEAMALYNATVVETDARRCEALADRIALIREKHDTPEIALREAKALYNATVGETDARRREALADRIALIREKHDTPEIALREAMALYNVTVVETDARRCEALADRIALIREKHDTPEIALREAMALYNVTVVETDARRCEALADRIALIREKHDTPEIALREAKALYNVTVVETDARRCEALADRIALIHEKHDTPEIALGETMALYNATAVETAARRCEALAERIALIRQKHDTPEIALQEAMALFNATVVEKDARRCEALADRIALIREKHDTPEIALPEAMALYNATVVEMDARRCEALADRIALIREKHDTPEIALQEAEALCNATVVEKDARRREALADRIALIREKYDTPEIRELEVGVRNL